jgi:hypothetical protein
MDFHLGMITGATEQRRMQWKEESRGGRPVRKESTVAQTRMMVILEEKNWLGKNAGSKWAELGVRLYMECNRERDDRVDIQASCLSN